MTASWLALGGALAPTVACAQAAGAQGGADQATLREVKRLMEEGQRLYLQENFTEAAARFLEAHAKVAHPAFLYNAAVAFARAGDGLNALHYFEAYLKANPDSPDAPKVRERIAVIRAYLRRVGLLTEEGASSATPGTGEGSAPAAAAGGSAEGPGTSPPAGGGEPDGATSEQGTTQAATQGGATGTGGAASSAERPPEGGSAGQPTVAARRLPASLRGSGEETKSIIWVEPNPPDAVITLKKDGQVAVRGRAPFQEAVAPGEYEVMIEHPDFRTIQTKVDVTPGHVYMLIVEMSQGQFLGYLRVASQPSDARVYLDDREEGSVGRTRWIGTVPVGKHKIWIEKPGYRTVEREIEVGVGDDVEVRVELERVTYGKLRIVANVPGAEVYVDDEKVGIVPYEGDHPAGRRHVRVVADGMKDWEGEIDLPRGQLVPIRVRLRPAVPRGGAWGALAVAVVAAGGGAYLMLEAERIDRDLQADRAAGRLVDDDPRISRGRWFTYGADAALGLSAVMAVLSFYYFVRDPLPDSEGRILQPRDWVLRPWTGRGLAGGTLQWRF